MDTSADGAALSDDSNATQADISGIDSPTPASDATSAAAGKAGFVENALDHMICDVGDYL